MDENKRDLGAEGTADTLKGKMKKAVGKVQDKVGELTGNEEMQAKGKEKELGGSVQSTVGKGKQKVDEAADVIRGRMKEQEKRENEPE
ncbi:CsbD-like protein [Thermosporothrix hazakensis]|jgi:uncharacterized protein YjbJ (UPF0337 family)|uniref:CsbD-like protein n=2 Tax=Thermosporothrix TaxID=768650 RepID=A0A326UG90_THEHA|nr:CsbD family protein [Thermosporothrix hazakensis]PZW36010.1 CsbD-like protein [Thermosporothrix hazakensis]BBH88476.1 hypothetical protein KTC_32270 [Thermosporothrix sp. COM3]GCE46662.1 hypothetical protein KTH_15310 [Thermosporothrix hazakensis]